MTKHVVNLFRGPLLHSKKTFDNNSILRIGSLVISFLLFLVILASFYFQSRMQKDITSLSVQLEDIQRANEKIGKTNSDGAKVNQRLFIMSVQTQKDLPFASLSARLNQFLESVALDARTDSLTFTTKNEFTTKLSFPSEESLLAFIDSLETQNFKDILARLRIGSFKVSQSSSQAQLKPIELSGTFK